ncbi:MAG: WYL domain-containing protein, partial [Bacillota bacterium]|nr:WYL domain-containing protein [Bacillota bacterium]
VIAYRLDRILHIKETQDNFSPIAGFNIDDYLANMWGMEQGEPFKVKVKFMKVGNVAYKIRRDLECRKNKKLTEYEDHIVYEDTVVGINNFKSWLRTYGGAAVVLEPKELREQMIESAKRCLEYYT